MQGSRGRLCKCGSADVLVHSGTVVRVGVHGTIPHSVDLVDDPFEAPQARCAECGGSRRRTTTAGVHDRLGMTVDRPGSQLERLPMDEAVCGCGSTGASLVLYGDAYALVRDGKTAAGLLRPLADPSEGHRWGCALRPFGGCPRFGPTVASARADALRNAAAFLARLPDLTVGPEAMPRGVTDGWPARAGRVRSVKFADPPTGTTFIDEAWLERPRAVADAAAYVAAGLPPSVLRAVYPVHPAPSRSGTARRKCGGEFAGTWQGAGLAPLTAAAWFGAGVWPCCAKRYASAGFGPEDAQPWLAAGFPQPSEAGAWADAGFGPDGAKAWADAGVTEPASAGACRDAGLSPAKIVKWAWIWGGRQARSSRRASGPSPSARDISEILTWQAGGLHGRDARAWARAGFTARESVEHLPPGHPDRPDGHVLAAMAALHG